MVLGNGGVLVVAVEEDGPKSGTLTTGRIQ